MPMTPEQREHAELLMLYQASAEVIRSFQDRQTNITYLTALLYGAVIGYASAFGKGFIALLLLGGVLALTATASLRWLQSLEDAMARSRAVVEGIRDHFQPAVRQLFQARSYRRSTEPLLRGVVIVGCLMAIVAVWAMLYEPLAVG